MEKSLTSFSIQKTLIYKSCKLKKTINNTGEHIIFMKECRKQNLHLIECTKSMIIAHVYHCIYQQRWKIFIFIVCRMYTCLWYTVLARARILVLSLMLVQSTQKHVYIFVHKGWNQFNIFFCVIVLCLTYKHLPYRSQTPQWGIPGL